jgi:hypothetical protein
LPTAALPHLKNAWREILTKFGQFWREIGRCGGRFLANLVFNGSKTRKLTIIAPILAGDLESLAGRGRMGLLAGDLAPFGGRWQRCGGYAYPPESSHVACHQTQILCLEISEKRNGDFQARGVSSAGSGCTLPGVQPILTKDALHNSGHV